MAASRRVLKLPLVVRVKCRVVEQGEPKVRISRITYLEANCESGLQMECVNGNRAAFNTRLY